MGATISSLVFRPPIKPTPIKSDRFFYIDIPSQRSTLDVLCSPTACAMGPENHFSSTSECKEQELHKIPAFFLLHRNAKLTILYSHGNAEDLGMMYKRMKELARILCVNVMAYDYSGYGLSTPKCKPSEKLCCRNIDAAYTYLTTVMKISPSRIILYGRSLGSGPSCYLAKKSADEGQSIAGLILHSPFLSIYRIVVDIKSGIVGDMFRSYTRAGDIRCPVFVIHGEEDQVVPFWHSDELLRLFEPRYRAQPYFVKGMGHNNIAIKMKAEYTSRISTFLKRYVLEGDGTVPVHERYDPGYSIKDSGKFLINDTWVKHGASIINDAMKPNTVNVSTKSAATPTQILSSIPITPNRKLEQGRGVKMRKVPSIKKAVNLQRATSLLSQLFGEAKVSKDQPNESTHANFIDTNEDYVHQDDTPNSSFLLNDELKTHSDDEKKNHGKNENGNDIDTEATSDSENTFCVSASTPSFPYTSPALIGSTLEKQVAKGALLQARISPGSPPRRFKKKYHICNDSERHHDRHTPLHNGAMGGDRYAPLGNVTNNAQL